MRSLVLILLLLCVVASVAASPIGNAFVVSSTGRFPDVAYGSDKYLVVWPDYAYGPTQVRGRLIDSDGNSFGVSFTISDASSYALYPNVAYNAVNDPDLGGDVGWTPTLFINLQPAQRALSAVLSDAGPFGW